VNTKEYSICLDFPRFLWHVVSRAENITDLVLQEVDRVGLFRTISMEEIKRMLEHEQQKIMMGCDDTSCLAEVGGALGVELLLAGDPPGKYDNKPTETSWQIDSQIAPGLAGATLTYRF
jgi:hypothetical protein